MKITWFFYFLFMNSLYAMQHDTGTLALLSAIEKGNVAEFEELVNYIIRPDTYGSPESMRLLLGRHNLNTTQISDTSTRIKKTTAQRASTLCNPSFYKNVGISVACFSSAAALTGLFIWVPISNHEFDFLKNGWSIGSAVSILTAMGAQHMKKALKNEDAHNEYAKQLAIKLLVQKLIPHNQREPA